MYQIVPMTGIANNKFQSKIYVDGSNIAFTFRLTYNELAKYWLLDISVNDEMKISALPLTPSQNLLEQFDYLGLGSLHVLPRSQLKTQWPDYENLTSDWYIVWGDTDG